MSGREPADERIAEALRLLAEAARGRLERHPAGHLASAGGEDLSLEVPVAVGRRGGGPDAARAVGEALDRAVDSLLAHRAAFRPGAVFCLRCGSAECEHAAPGDPREVFAGYGATGVPRFLDFAQLLLERSDPRVDRLWQRPSPLLAHTVLGRDLAAGLLPAYRPSAAGHRVHGQVVAGWYEVPSPTGRPEPVALTFQAVSTRAGGGRARRRLGLNVVGRAPGGEPLETLHDRLGELPWADAVREAQEELAEIERRRAAGKGDGRALDRPALAVLNRLAGRLERVRRAKQRKTRHARERHAQGDRPTRMALADLARANEEQVLVDRRQETLVVLGERGRAHVFNPGGRLVTSLRTTPESVARRQRRDHWRPASRDEVAELKSKALAAGGDAAAAR